MPTSVWIPLIVSTTVSILALAISATVAWLTLLRRGSVKMTQPTVIFFGNDSGGYGPPKIYLRTLLYPTAKRGRVIQSIHATLTRNESRQTFNIWVYGEKNLLRGSGLFVGETGVVANHHFVLPSDGSTFSFVSGTYLLEVVAQFADGRETTRLWTQTLELTGELARGLEDKHMGVYFDWGPDSQRYVAHFRRAPTAPTPHELVEAMGIPRTLDDT